MGEDTERWLYYGNRLYQSSVLTGLTSIFIGKHIYLFKKLWYFVDLLILAPFFAAIYWNDRKLLPFPFSFTSCLCASLYTVCWAFDPCSRYKVWNTQCGICRILLHITFFWQKKIRKSWKYINLTKHFIEKDISLVFPSKHFISEKFVNSRLFFATYESNR